MYEYGSHSCCQGGLHRVRCVHITVAGPHAISRRSSYFRPGRGGGGGKCSPERKDGSGVDGRQLRQRQPPRMPMADFGLLTFARGEGTGEWDYPWDLTGGLYR